MLKKFLSLILALLMIFSSFGVGFASAAGTDDATMVKLQELIKRFPHGKYWNHKPGSANNSESVTDTPCTHHWNCDYYGTCGCNSYGIAIQCMGFAHKLAYEITGVDVEKYTERRTLDITKLRVGDVIRINNDYHSVCVTGVNGNQISIAQANYPSNCVISWVTVDKSFFNNVTYVLHLEGNERKNTDVNWHDIYTGIINPNEPEVPAKADEIWQISDTSIDILKEKKSSSTRVATIPSGGKFTVYEKSIVDGSLWAKVNYQGKTGYSVLDHATYISGAYERPEISNVKDIYISKNGMVLKWSPVSGANKYKIIFYDENKKLIKNIETSGTSFTASKPATGKYYVRIYACNNKIPFWCIPGAMKSFRVVTKIVDLEKITLPETKKVYVGKRSSLLPEFTPANATYQDLVWKTSDKKVATVSSDGRVTGVAPGKVTVTCTSKVNSKISASCAVTVRPTSVKVMQTKAGTSKSSVGLSWDVSKGATDYVLYKKDTQTNKYEMLATLKGNTYTVKNLEPATEYTFTVRPYALVNEEEIHSGFKDYTAKTTPDAIENLRQTGTNTGRVKLSWEEKSGADAYDVYKYNPSTKKYVKIATTTDNMYVDVDKSATKVYYKVVSIVKTDDGYARSKASSEFMAITGLDKLKITATKSNKTAVKLDWSSVKYATGYQIYREINGERVLLATVASDKLTYTDKSLESKKTYTYHIRAVRNHSEKLKLYSSYTKVKVKTT